MIKTFLTSMFAIFLFALGAAGAWFYLQMQTDLEESTGAASAEAFSSPPADVDPIPPLPSSAESESAIRGLAAAHRGSALDAEKLYQLKTINEKERAQRNAHEEKLRELNLRIKAGDADMKSAQREVEGAITQVQSLMDATEKLLGEVKLTLETLQKEKLEVQKKRDALDESQKNLGVGEAKNIKTFAEIVQSMPPDTAAETLKEMWNDGKMDFAIQLMRNIEPRSVAKILAEVKDPQLVAELASRYPKAVR